MPRSKTPQNLPDGNRDAQGRYLKGHSIPGPGRDREYEERFCEIVENTMREGFSKMAAAGRIGVSFQTIINWMRDYPAFFDAVKRGEAARTELLEKQLLEAEIGPKVTARIFALKNAAPDEWSDRRSVEMSGPKGAPIQTKATIALDGMDLEELEALQSVLSKITQTEEEE